MTRRDYELIAQALNVARPPYLSGEAWYQHRHVCNVIAGTLKAGNPAFDYELFMRNSGLQS